MKIINKITENQAQKLGLIVKDFKVLKGEQCISTEKFYFPSNGEWKYVNTQVRRELATRGVSFYPIGQGKLNSLFSEDKEHCLLNSGSRDYQILVKFYNYFAKKRRDNDKKRFLKQVRTVKKFTGNLVVGKGHESWSARSRSKYKEYNFMSFQGGKLVKSELLYSENFYYQSGDRGYGLEPSSKEEVSGRFDEEGQMWKWLENINFEIYNEFTRDNHEYENLECTLCSNMGIVEKHLLKQDKN